MFSVKIAHISDKIVFQGTAKSALLPGVMGSLEIVDHHVPIVSLLANGAIVLDGLNESIGQKTFSVRQGLMRFDGQALYVVVE